MTTDTPRTDDAENECNCAVNGAIIRGVVTSAFARELERENVLLTNVLNQARETLLISIKGTPEDLQRSLGKLNLACKAHWDWQTEKMR